MLCLREVLEPRTLHRDFQVDPKVGCQHSGVQMCCNAITLRIRHIIWVPNLVNSLHVITRDVMSSATLNGGSCRCEPEKGPWRSNCHDPGSGGREGSVAQGDVFFLEVRAGQHQSSLANVRTEMQHIQ